MAAYAGNAIAFAHRHRATANNLYIADSPRIQTDRRLTIPFDLTAWIRRKTAHAAVARDRCEERYWPIRFREKRCNQLLSLNFSIKNDRLDRDRALDTWRSDNR